MHPSRLAPLCLMLAAGAAQAQATLGDVLARGGQKLHLAEVRALGDLRLLRSAPDADAFMTMRADGSVVGIVHNKEGHGSSEAVGSWSMDANGRRCIEVALPAFNSHWKQCGYTYRVGGSIYFVASDSDRNVVALREASPAFLRR